MKRAMLAKLHWPNKAKQPKTFRLLGSLFQLGMKTVFMY
ncbi:hypothetical protein BafACA1_A29 (plasmid) [Borreliella afzelii ACA-1]|nr:hypothetical protein BafACA1_A29 [Borreliella afzelii ACA-1]